MKITFLGHSSFHILINGTNLIIDPFITPNKKAAKIEINKLKADYILVSHGHSDHLADVDEIAKNTEAKVISNYEIATWYGEKGINSHPLNHGGKINLDFGTIKYVNAVHTSSLPDGSNGGNPGGFVIWDESECIYFAGDTALTLDMQLIPLTCPKLTAAILPIGDKFTMGYEDAIIASDFVKCDKIIPCHYDTFELIQIDKEVVKTAFEEKNKEIYFLDIGESLETN